MTSSKIIEKIIPVIAIIQLPLPGLLMRRRIDPITESRHIPKLHITLTGRTRHQLPIVRHTQTLNSQTPMSSKHPERFVWKKMPASDAAVANTRHYNVF